ncbi:MAG: hypothetical protein ACTS84_03920, partial [Arsenophonus sp. NC-LC2-MAG3]
NNLQLGKNKISKVETEVIPNMETVKEVNDVIEKIESKYSKRNVVIEMSFDDISKINSDARVMSNKNVEVIEKNVANDELRISNNDESLKRTIFKFSSKSNSKTFNGLRVYSIG